ncbi:MAG: STAS/SEC14 domain-containing protein [Hyphomicrobiales bacterium]
MFELQAEQTESVLVIKVTGKIRAEDYFDFMPELNERIAETNPKGVLVDSAEFEGWQDEEARSIGFFSRTQYRSKFERVAVLADADWTSEVQDLQDETNLPVRQFPVSDRQQALDWLTSPD